MSLIKYGKCETMATLILGIFSLWLEEILNNSIPEAGSNLKLTQFGRGGEEQPVTSKGPFLQELHNNSVMNKTLFYYLSGKYPVFITIVESVFILKWAASHEETKPRNISQLPIKLMQDNLPALY